MLSRRTAAVNRQGNGPDQRKEAKATARSHLSRSIDRFDSG